MARRAWLLVGAGFGFTIPILLNVLRLILPVRPTAYFLFRPGLAFLIPVGGFLERSLDFFPLLTGVLTFLLNAAIF